MSSVEIDFSPADNTRLANLCGVLDENIKQIEASLDVTIARRGERFSVLGETGQVELAARALQSFYGKARKNLSVEDIQIGLLDFRRQSGKTAVPAGGDVVLMTRRADLRGRTARQQQYMENIREHDITFGVGPAGTGKTYLAVASAVDALERDAVKRIVLVRRKASAMAA